MFSSDFDRTWQSRFKHHSSYKGCKERYNLCQLTTKCVVSVVLVQDSDMSASCVTSVRRPQGGVCAGGRRRWSARPPAAGCIALCYAAAHCCTPPPRCVLRGLQLVHAFVVLTQDNLFFALHFCHKPSLMCRWLHSVMLPGRVPAALRYLRPTDQEHAIFYNFCYLIYEHVFNQFSPFSSFFPFLMPEIL